MKKILPIVLFVLLIAGCSQQKKFIKNPVDIIIRDLSMEKDFSVILYDMDYNESEDKYKHQYQILISKEQPDTVVSKTTDWYEVSDELFNKHINDMGMVIASKTNGKVKKAVSPPGYNNYVGNEKYGRWQQRDGGTFWEFYGKYAFMSSMFRMMTYPVHYGYWNDYRRNYYGAGRSYYGPMTTGGNRMYGTGGAYNSSFRKNSTWSSKPSSFKERVRSKVSRSASRSRSSYRKSRSSSRYKSSSYRSRGGGFGK